jgi:quinoprotein glucose dehydrogenase
VGARRRCGLEATSCRVLFKAHKVSMLLTVAVATLGICVAASSAQSPKSRDWPVFNGDSEGDHYSPLSQINRQNVAKLQVAWQFDTGEEGGLEVNPIVIAGVVYANTPTRKVVALDAASGKLIWKFDSGSGGIGPVRGVAYWTDGKQSRIFTGVGSFLYALNAPTGKVLQTFGESGRIDLRKGLGGDYTRHSFSLTSPGIVYKDIIIVGGKEPEEHPAAPGDIRAFDVHTGALRWAFHTIPHPGEFGYSTWPKDAWINAGAANNWAGMALDAKRGIVYAPTGSAVPDLYGADRAGDDLFANTLLALDAETGKRIWHFQAVHHDLWDRDFPSPPVLLTVRRGSTKVDAVAQTTKSGYVFLFNRITGKPLFPIQELNYPSSTVPGEVTSPTQPLPTLPLPFTRQGITEDTLTTRTPEAHAWAVKQYKTFASGGGGQFAPPSLNKLTVALPGPNGGAEWGGSAVDLATGILYVNANETPRTFGLAVPPKPVGIGQSVYQQRCSACHGLDKEGSPPSVPSLVGIDHRLTDQEIKNTVLQGKGRMPQFTDVNEDQLISVIRYLKSSPIQPGSGATSQAAATVGTQAGGDKAEAPTYKSLGNNWFVDPDGYPAVKPPWGTLSAIDMNTGQYVWKIPLGTYPELVAKGLKDTGSVNYGGPLATGGGILFIGATVYDRKFHAYDSKTGELLWETELPFPGLATPSTYMVNGRQYVLIASGGQGGFQFRGATGGIYVAFALPTASH